MLAADGGTYAELEVLDEIKAHARGQDEVTRRE